MAFDLPIDEVKAYINDLMLQIGDEVVIDGITTRVMIADLDRVVTNLQQNMKQTVLMFDVVIDRGSRMDFTDGRVGIVYTVPNDDMVSKSAQILLCNSKPSISYHTQSHDLNPQSKTYGDIIGATLLERGQFYGFIERLTAKEKQYDVGLLHDAVLLFTTFSNTEVELNDIVVYDGKDYKVIDVDDITDGVRAVQLAYVRT